MRVGILYGDPLKKGGIAAYSQLLAKALKREGHLPYLINFSHLKSRLYKHPTSGIRELLLTMQLGNLAYHLRRKNILDLVWSNSYYGATAKPDITVFHFTYPGLHKRLGHNPIKTLGGTVLERMVSKAPIVISVSDFIAKEVKEYYGIDSIVIENAIETKRFSKQHPLADTLQSQLREVLKRDFIALFVGRFTQRKGADIVLHLANRLPQVGFVMILGYGSSPSNVPENVLVLSQISGDEIPAYYQAADVVIFPTRYEPFGYITVEGWSAGRIVLTTAQGVAQKLKQHTPFKNWVTDSEIPDPSWFERRLAIVTKMSRRERREIEKEGQRFIIQNYDLRRWQKEISEVINIIGG